MFLNAVFVFTSLQLSLIPLTERWVEKDSNWISDTVGRLSVPCGCLESMLSVSNRMLLACWEKPSDCTASIHWLTTVSFRDTDVLNIHLRCQRFIIVRKYPRQSAHLKERLSFATVLEDSIHGCWPLSWTAGDTHTSWQGWVAKISTYLMEPGNQLERKECGLNTSSIYV